MSFNIKNSRAHSLARQIAELPGESLTTVVVRALEERLRIESEKRNGRAKADRILKLAERLAGGMPSECRSQDHAALLNVEDGMPR